MFRIESTIYSMELTFVKNRLVSERFASRRSWDSHLTFRFLFLFLFIQNCAQFAHASILLQKRWAVLSLYTNQSLTQSSIKNLILADSALYGFNSPSNQVFSRVMSVKCADHVNNFADSNSTFTNQTESFLTQQPTTVLNDKGCCSTYSNRNELPSDFVALVSRGDCSFDKKIIVAAENGARAIIIYNDDQNLFTMLSRNNSIVNVLVSNYVGNLLLTWSSEVPTYITIRPSSVEYFNDDDMMPTRASVYFIFFTFVLIVIISTLWVIVYFIQKYRYQTAKKRLEKKLRKATMKALSKMVVRQIKAQDKELNETCPICLDNYQVGEMVRELPCNHYFHQKDIDMWLIEHRNCPMCKIDVLQACGIQINNPQNFFVRHIFSRLRLRPSTFEQISTNPVPNSNQNSNSSSPSLNQDQQRDEQPTQTRQTRPATTPSNHRAVDRDLEVNESRNRSEILNHAFSLQEEYALDEEVANLNCLQLIREKEVKHDSRARSILDGKNSSFVILTTSYESSMPRVSVDRSNPNQPSHSTKYSKVSTILQRDELSDEDFTEIHL